MTSKSKQLNVRIPPLTQLLLRELEERTGLTLTQIVIMAIDRLAHAELHSSVLSKPRR